MDDTAKVIAALRERFPHIIGPRQDVICYATTNRQDAGKQLALECGLVLVVGSPSSSNSNRLKELAERCGAEAYLIEGAEDIREEWLSNKPSIGITAGASAPEVLVQGVITRLQGLGGLPSQELEGRDESIRFTLPKELRELN
jgi:4-hydroxy-3-methylbut-2-enyl diphosphate reductase